MSKLSYEDKVIMYKDWRDGASLATLSQKYNIRTQRAQYLCYLVEKHV